MHEEQIQLKADRLESRSAEDAVSLAVLAPSIIVQELCESRGGRPGLPYSRSCVRVEVAVLGSHTPGAV